ncbi:MAG: DUF3467 domain-containing protein [Elusimicrobiota bacterium]|jgi:hypothetical protein|nr:DUF3467 domain-containing protein [Elusimicrobiota bacterium]
MEEEKKNEVKSEIKIEIDEETSSGVYSNLAMISHTDSEFILDFIFIQPQYGKAKVRSRVITSPAHAKRMLAALQDNVSKYETQFGEIKDSSLRVQEPKTKYYN